MGGAGASCTGLAQRELKSRCEVRYGLDLLLLEDELRVRGRLERHHRVARLVERDRLAAAPASVLLQRDS